MKKNKKIVLILLSIMVLLTNSIVFATIDTEYYKPNELTKEETNKVLNMAGKILATIRNVGVIISVIVLSIIGLKYMLCSVDEKANYKENMIPYVVGCFLLAMSTTIPSIIYSVLN